MVWEQGSVVIVSLTKLTENGVAMCHRYWPEEGSELYHIYEVPNHNSVVSLYFYLVNCRIFICKMATPGSAQDLAY